MFDFSAYNVVAADMHGWASVFALWVVSKFIGNEQRTYTIAICALLLVPSPATLYVILMFSLVFRLFDMWKPT